MSNDRRYVRRDEKGQFENSVEVKRSLPDDARHSAKTKLKAGQGDRGDRKS